MSACSRNRSGTAACVSAGLRAYPLVTDHLVWVNEQGVLDVVFELEVGPGLEAKQLDDYENG